MKRQGDLLLGHLRQYRPIVPVRVAHGIQKDLARGACIFTALLVTDFVKDEEQIDEVAAGPELVEVCVGVRVGYKQLVTALNKVGTLSIGEQVVAVNPSGRLRCSSLVVWVR